MADLESEKQEAQKRIDALPENLKKELLADKNVDLVFSIAQDYKLDDDQTEKISLLVAEVFLGYIKPEQVASELNKYFGVDLQKSNFIEIELKQKLFNPLRADLAKIYNPPKISAEEETEKPEEEFAPAIIKPELEVPSTSSGQTPTTTTTAAPITIANIPIQTAPIAEEESKTSEQETAQKISPLTISSIPIQPAKIENLPTVGIPKNEPVLEEAPFIIQTKVEAVKRAMPQFQKEGPSVNLKVDESILEKSTIAKPVSVRLETEQPGDNNIRFKMPVMANQPKIEIKPITNQLPRIEIKPPVQEKPVIPENISSLPISQIKPISEQKSIFESKQEQPKVVHYSTFKTPLTIAGTPKKIEPKKEDIINLATFTKLTGNTVDLRSKSSNN